MNRLNSIQKTNKPRSIRNKRNGLERRFFTMSLNKSKSNIKKPMRKIIKRNKITIKAKKALPNKCNT
jgi:hypothetical protein